MKATLLLTSLLLSPQGGATPELTEVQPTSTATSATTATSAAPSERVVPQHPAVRRLVLELMAEGYEIRAKLLEEKAPQSEEDFLRVMHESYKSVQREGLPSSYIAYMDELSAWLDSELPKIEQRASNSARSKIFDAYNIKLRELEQKYRQAHATLTSKNNEFKNLLEEVGILRRMNQDMAQRRQAFRDTPQQALSAHFRLLASWLRDEIEKGK